MPILHVELVRGTAPPPPDLAQRLADAAGAVFGAPPRTTWVRLLEVDARAYAENGGRRDGAPVLVTVRKRALPAGDALAAEARALTAALAEACGRPPEEVHVCYEPPAAGRQAFGGTLVE